MIIRLNKQGDLDKLDKKANLMNPIKKKLGSGTKIAIAKAALPWVQYLIKHYDISTERHETDFSA